mgnify:CR=1 FL=1
MNFLKDLIELNNEIELKKKAEKQFPTDDEEAMKDREDFIARFNKRNNRLFKPSNQCYLHVYEQKLSRSKIDALRKTKNNGLNL